MCVGVCDMWVCVCGDNNNTGCMPTSIASRHAPIVYHNHVNKLGDVCRIEENSYNLYHLDKSGYVILITHLIIIALSTVC